MYVMEFRTRSRNKNACGMQHREFLERVMLYYQSEFFRQEIAQRSIKSFVRSSINSKRYPTQHILLYLRIHDNGIMQRKLNDHTVTWNVEKKLLEHD